MIEINTDYEVLQIIVKLFFCNNYCVRVTLRLSRLYFSYCIPFELKVYRSSLKFRRKSTSLFNFKMISLLNFFELQSLNVSLLRNYLVLMYHNY